MKEIIILNCHKKLKIVKSLSVSNQGQFNIDICWIIFFINRAPQLDEGDQNEGEEGEEKDAIQKKQEHGEEEEEGGQDQNQDFCDFTVYISRPNNKTMIYECTSFDSEVKYIIWYDIYWLCCRSILTM